ncbi:hypothetical protein DDB_G0268086 [Dictyostelium discoideum AX4]|uniref:Putative uncharacterized protein DDB_G0268086 n=1 Tax=Dictyostelium discoideum TaxID=44689 RepID=Y9767_DICDI|nr:hypothetical protein DDB_G0268086 [Dictyostelium discoideum AX4]Q55FJ1.1 RecName: Full=Putative uncharacterized protein DDB_G0268086 [Dictyostelium discoideum]EAL73496.1 hypothetical protein DDB_G0268086 [Dictyostelium discoideum AX4]|eukprot:XP_647542.1 hypothetical protein DDB_G0268086 [Dictyostelium discoideum AX4]
MSIFRSLTSLSNFNVNKNYNNNNNNNNINNIASTKISQESNQTSYLIFAPLKRSFTYSCYI